MKREKLIKLIVSPILIGLIIYLGGCIGGASFDIKNWGDITRGTTGIFMPVGVIFTIAVILDDK